VPRWKGLVGTDEEQAAGLEASGEAREAAALERLVEVGEGEVPAQDEVEALLRKL